MENLVYLIVKGLSVTYLLCNAYRFLSGKTDGKLLAVYNAGN
jgi:hypothetical protein